MKRKVISISTVVCILIALILFVHPVKVLSDTSYRYIITVSKTSTELESVVPMAGGVRCYINEDEYIWYSLGTYETVDTSEALFIKWGFPWENDIISRGDVSHGLHLS